MNERARAIRQAVNRFAFHRDQHHGWRRAAGWLLLCNALTLAALGGMIALYAPSTSPWRRRPTAGWCR